MQLVSVVPGERFDVALGSGIEELPERPPVSALVADTPQRGQPRRAPDHGFALACTTLWNRQTRRGGRWRWGLAQTTFFNTR